MCGLCGIVTPGRARTIINADQLRRMRDELGHRGPDGEGTLVMEGVGLAHRRLAIIDVAHGAQPMSTSNGRYHISYNGEVYNHPTLQAALQADGVHYRTNCDTETILHLYARHGAAALEQLRGMFAIAIWDSERRELFLARDRFGVKPLYYASLPDGTLIFGSEIKSVLASGLIRAALRHSALPDYLANYATTGDETLFEGIRRLPPGHSLTWRDGTIALHRYWDLDPSDKPLQAPDADLVAEYRARLTESVRLRLMSDVPLGVFLSGGIDSAAITAVMSELVDEPIRSFSVAFQEREANELQYARLVARRFGTRHEEVTLSRNDFFALLPRMIWHEDEPLAHPSSIALHAVSALAARHVKVVLTGEGSDETLAGYNRYRMALLNLRIGGWYERVLPAGLRAAGRELTASLTSDTGRRLSRTFLGRTANLDSLYFENFSVFSSAWQRRLLAPDMRAELRGIDPYLRAHDAMGAWRGRPLLDRMLYSDLKTYLHELLMKQDQMSMAASIESRVPFLDHPLVEWCMRLPPHLKLRGLNTKVILRRAMTGVLPPEILARRKMGFPVPIGNWFRGAEADRLRSVLLSERALERGLFNADVVRELVDAHQQGRAQHGERLWMLLNFEIWQRVFLDGEPVADVMPSPSLSASA